MITNRRRFLTCIAGGMLSGIATLRGFCSGRAPDEPANTSVTCSRDEVARMLESVAGSSVTVAERITWIATATVTLFSLPVFSRRGVGSGYAVVEEAHLGTGQNAISIQFGAGSWPETAHGLNRFGLIHEVTVENGSGEPDESAYGAFITTSREKSLDQANQSLRSSDTNIPYVAAQGHAARGRFAARVNDLEFPSHYTWRDADSLMPKVRDVIANSVCPSESERGGAGLFPLFRLQSHARCAYGNERKPLFQRQALSSADDETARSFHRRTPGRESRCDSRGRCDPAGCRDSGTEARP